MGAVAPVDDDSLVIFRKPVAGMSPASLSRFVARAQRAAGVGGRVTVLVTGSRELRDLNRRFRGEDHATDVLSFPAIPIPSPVKVTDARGAGESSDAAEGDIAISVDIAVRNAARLGHSAAAELKILALHGLLHLGGYDHEQDQGEMAEREARLRRELCLPETLIARAAGEVERPEPSKRSRITAAPTTNNNRRTTRRRSR